MLTIEDIRDSNAESGFRYVGRAGGARTKPWRAQRNAGGSYGSAHTFRGLTRATPEEAAQDYVDYVNGVAKPLTIEDIRNPARRSGFDHVGDVGMGGTAGRRTPGWRASKACPRGATGPGITVDNHGTTKKWRGPTRQDPAMAAQDYCDYVNSQRPQQTKPALKSAGHAYNIEKTERDPEVEAALGVLRDARAQREGKDGFVYLIIEVLRGGALHYGKVGYSVNPRKRVAELQTGNPRPLALHCMKKGTVADEAALHVKYIKDNSLQEWFVISKELLLEFDLDSEGKPFTSADEVADETNKEASLHD